MAALKLFIFSLLVASTFAQDADKEDRPEFQALPMRLGAPGTQKEFYFHVYYHEITEGTKKNSVTVVKPNGDAPVFGQIIARDVPLWNNNKQEKLVARAQGISLVADQAEGDGVHSSWTIKFEKAYKQLEGSTLQVMGIAEELTGTTRQWAIVGGTGNLTLAQGVIYGRQLSSMDGIWIELKICGYYTPMQAPGW